MIIKNIQISTIKIKRSRRAINKEKVRQIADSIALLGLLHPICINKERYLVAGRHRVEAFKLLGRKTIPAISIEKGIKADLVEIDENLIRHDLTILERAEQLQKRKALYQELYPEPIKGGPGRGHREKQRNHFVPFSSDTASKVGVSRRSVEQDVQIAKNISKIVKRMIKNIDLADNKNELLKLARLDHKTQHKVVKLYLKNDGMTIDDIAKELSLKDKIKKAERERKNILKKGAISTLPDDIQIHRGDSRKLFPKIYQSLKKKYGADNLLVLFDPPYNIQFDGYDGYIDNLPDTQYIKMMKMFKGLPLAVIQYPEEMMSLIYPALGKPDEVLSWCYNTNIHKAFRLINIYNAEPDFTRIRQPYKNPTDKRVQKRIKVGSSGAALYDWFSDIQLVKNVSRQKAFHPCQVPIELMERLILLLGDEDTVVIDPYMGVGTTGLACQKLNRRFVGIEVSKNYYDIAKYRLSQHNN